MLGSPAERCTVERKCSSVGKACAVEDRACQTRAVSDGLEITCERLEDPRTFVYCPPGAQQRDSSIVWILLTVAVGVAAIGGILSVLLFRKRLTASSDRAS